MSNGYVKVKLGGVERPLKVTIGIAPQIEAATGKGIFAVVRELANMSAPTSVVVAVLEATHEANGVKIEDMYEAMAVEGIVVHFASATAILAELLKPPAKASKSKNGVAASVPN